MGQTIGEPKADPKAEKTARVQIDLDKTPKGDREFDIDGERLTVPGDCKGGIGSWHPRNPECATCQLVPLCFCKVTRTRVMITQISKAEIKSSKDAKMPKPKASDDPSDLVFRAFNPFNTDSTAYAGRQFFLRILETGTRKFADADAIEEFCEAQKVPRPKPRETHPRIYVDELLRYSKIWNSKAPPAECVPFFGCVNIVGTKPLNMEFSIDIEMARRGAENLKRTILAELEQKIAEKAVKDKDKNAERQAKKDKKDAARAEVLALRAAAKAKSDAQRTVERAAKKTLADGERAKRNADKAKERAAQKETLAAVRAKAKEQIDKIKAGAPKT